MEEDHTKSVDSNFELSDESSGVYLKVKATRNSLFTEHVELVLVNSADKVVTTFRAEQEGGPSVSDFGAIFKELESIRQKLAYWVSWEKA